MSLKSKVDITGGPIAKSIIAFAIPIILGALIQTAFTAADLMVVGNMGSENDIGSVGAVSSIVNLLVNSFIGLGAGVNAVLARCIGQRNEARSSRITSTAIIFSFVFGILLTVSFLIFSKPLLAVTKCPEECFDGAVRYMQIYAVGIPAVMVYNFAAAIIRTTGETQKPFLYLVIAGITNVVLNVLLCLVLEEKVAAVAVATTSSQIVSAVLCMRYLMKQNGGCSFSFKKLSFSFSELFAIFKVGLPCAFNSALFSLSNVQMHAAINSYGAAATAGNAAATNVEQFTGAFSTGFNSAAVPFVGQNVGAGNKDRVKKSIGFCILVSASIAIVAGNLLYLLGEPILTLFGADSPDAITAGLSRMKHILLFYVIAAIMNIYASALQAFGYSFLTMMNSIVTVFVFRMIWLEFIYPPLEAIEHTIDNVYLCYTVSWSLTFLAHLVAFLIVFLRYMKTGKVKRL